MYQPWHKKKQYICKLEFFFFKWNLIATSGATKWFSFNCLLKSKCSRTKSKFFKKVFIPIYPHLLYCSGFELAIRNLQFAKCFGSLRMSFCIFSKNCESLKSDTLWILRVIHWTSYIVSYYNTPLLNNNVISQRFVVCINFMLHISFFPS